MFIFQFLQEIIRWSPTAGGNVALVVGHGREDAEFRVEVVVHGHDGRDIAAAVTVVGRGPDGDDRLFWEVVLQVFVRTSRGKET